MSELRFDGQVAIVTGAGGNPGLGRSYAMLLAARGAKVVVNDYGITEHFELDQSRAQAVADEIVAAGGEAVADTHSVAEEESAAAIVGTALAYYGRIDAVINNAGYSKWAQIDEIPSSEILKIVSTNLLGSIWMCRAAWPHMRTAGYGRIVNVASTAMVGNPNGSLYAAAKGGNFGLTRALARDGAASGIKVNIVVPRALTASIMAKTAEWSSSPMVGWRPDQVAQTTVFLAHAECSASGKCIAAAGGHVRELFLREATGYTNDELTLEDVRDNFDRIVDRSDAADVPDPNDLPVPPVVVTAPAATR
jgi:NAD(P)-dependent dehydrogenase (short-subunit alcohol dehydrogenase family)